MSLFSIFKKFPNIDALKFPTHGLIKAVESRDEKIWTNSQNDEIALYFFNKIPNIPISDDGICGLRAGYERLIDDPRVGIISFDVVDVSGIPSIVMLLRCFEAGKIEKYVGSVTIPFKDFSYVIKVNSSDNGPTGIRAAVLFAKLKKMNSAKDKNTDESMGKVNYDSDEYDDILPNHSLSRGRRLLKEIIRSINMDKRLLDFEKFNFKKN